VRGGAGLVVLVLVGGIIVLIFLESKRKTGAATTAPAAGLTNDPYATQLISLQSQIIDASGALGKTAGGAAGAVTGYGVSSAEQNVAKGLGETPVDPATIARLQNNAAQNGLTAGATVGANVGGAGGGALGGGVGGFFGGLGTSLHNAGVSWDFAADWLKTGGTADQLGLPKWGG
jgi:hypothetical protein